MDLRTGTATQMLASVPVLGVATLAIEHLQVSRPLPLAGSLAWLVLVNSIGTFTLMYAMLRHRSASQVSSLFFLTPAVTAIMAYVFLGQALGWLTVAGLMVSGAGVILASRGSRAPAAASVPPGQARVPQRSPAAAVEAGPGASEGAGGGVGTGVRGRAR
jgi:drug/metabolite transporter (DMT)-like permease